VRHEVARIGQIVRRETNVRQKYKLDLEKGSIDKGRLQETPTQSFIWQELGQPDHKWTDAYKKEIFRQPNKVNTIILDNTLAEEEHSVKNIRLCIGNWHIWK
jgi:hypothetical protein